MCDGGLACARRLGLPLPALSQKSLPLCRESSATVIRHCEPTIGCDETPALSREENEVIRFATYQTQLEELLELFGLLRRQTQKERVCQRDLIALTKAIHDRELKHADKMRLPLNARDRLLEGRF